MFRITLSYGDFPSFLEGLSLRRHLTRPHPLRRHHFPSFLGRAFIEARPWHGWRRRDRSEFPFLFGRAFIEAHEIFDELEEPARISLPFWKGFH